MFDPHPRVSRPLAMLSVVLLLTTVFAPTAFATAADHERPSFSLDFVVDFFGDWMGSLFDAASTVLDPNGQPAPTPPPPPPLPGQSTPDSLDPDNSGDDDGEASTVLDPNG